MWPRFRKYPKGKKLKKLAKNCCEKKRAFACRSFILPTTRLPPLGSLRGWFACMLRAPSHLQHPRTCMPPPARPGFDVTPLPRTIPLFSLFFILFYFILFILQETTEWDLYSWETPTYRSFGLFSPVKLVDKPCCTTCYMGRQN